MIKKYTKALLFSTISLAYCLTNTLSAIATPDVYVSTITQSEEVKSAPRTRRGTKSSGSLRDRLDETANTSDNTSYNTLVVTLPSNLQIDLDKSRSPKINLILAQPFKNFPAGSYLRATINQTQDGNAILIADTLYSNNKLLKIKAQSEILHSRTVTVSSRSQEAIKKTATFAPFGGLLGTALGEDVEDIIQITAIAGTLGYTTGILSPQKVRLLDLSAGTLIFFTLTSSQ